MLNSLVLVTLEDVRVVNVLLDWIDDGIVHAHRVVVEDRPSAFIVPGDFSLMFDLLAELIELHLALVVARHFHLHLMVAVHVDLFVLFGSL